MALKGDTAIAPLYRRAAAAAVPLYTLYSLYFVGKLEVHCMSKRGGLLEAF